MLCCYQLNEAGNLRPDPDTGEVPELPAREATDEDDKHAEWAFGEFDVNADGVVTWEEWSSMMYVPCSAHFFNTCTRC